MACAPRFFLSLRLHVFHRMKCTAFILRLTDFKTSAFFSIRHPFACFFGMHVDVINAHAARTMATC